MTNSSSCDSCGRPHSRWATDRLTLLLDRWGWDEQAPHVLAASPSTTLVVVDLDNFKGVNDRHGHVAGDAVLKAVADTLKQRTRKGDLVGRYGGHGGDEFLILLPDTVLDEALAVTERVRKDIQSLVVHAPTHGGTVRIDTITASFGVAVGSPGTDVESLIVEADAALRQAKKAGRNRVKAPRERRSPRAVPLALLGACAAGVVVVALVGDAPKVAQVVAAEPPLNAVLPTVTMPAVTVPTTVTMTATVQPPPRPVAPVQKPKQTPTKTSTAPATEEPSARAAERPPSTPTKTSACPVCDVVEGAMDEWRSFIPR
nr:GGDEF domain-containing protein [Kibdelosporangium sp. MJ126-NF4]CEL20249.1 diguanylate cyclase/phosphodiesterase (GGDEF & EAL domains) with PAS/PAC sensor(s) [Kibdelosporangium sp. MJ126-NF4]CTQ97475.1 diguanylate cyclase/phosphodiesterase (GGDEF & EAL domains) with PAS/PAC sensor(s) [Kibdelosporangium sp. MJ126-NF4]